MPRRAKPDKPDAIALLKEDHRKVEDLFEKFEKARDEDRKKSLAREICTELTIHAMIEEEIFYPSCHGQIEDEDLLDESYVEHDGAKVLVSELANSDPDNEFYDAKVSVLSEMIKHHVKEEEKRAEGLFAEAKDAGLDLEALGERLMQRKQELVDEFGEGDNLPAPETRSFTGHELHQGRPVETRRAAIIQRHFGRLFAEGRREGMIRRDVPVRLAIAILLAATQGVMNPPRIAELGTTPKAALSAILTVVLEGVLTKTGRTRL